MRTNRPTARSLRCGFTLVELVLVLIIVGVIGAIAMPRFAQASARQQLDAAANRVASDLEKARATARQTSNYAVITFEPNQDRYTFSSGSVQGSTVELDESPYQVKVKKAEFGDGTSVTFNGFGVPSDSGSVTLESSAGLAVVSLDAGGRVSR